MKYRIEEKAFGKVYGVPELGIMWVIKEDNDYVCAVNFLCPCGCGSECYTPVTDAAKGEPKMDHHWHYNYTPSGGVTITPSIRYVGGCKAHFNITNNEAIFHGDSGK